MFSITTYCFILWLTIWNTVITSHLVYACWNTLYIHSPFRSNNQSIMDVISRACFEVMTNQWTKNNQLVFNTSFINTFKLQACTKTLYGFGKWSILCCNYLRPHLDVLDKRNKGVLQTSKWGLWALLTAQCRFGNKKLWFPNEVSIFASVTTETDIITDKPGFVR